MKNIAYNFSLSLIGTIFLKGAAFLSNLETELDNLLLEVPEVANVLQISRRTVFRLIAEGKGELSAIRIGGRWKVRSKDIREYIEKKNRSSPSSYALFEEIIKNTIQKRNRDLHFCTEAEPEEQTKYLEPEKLPDVRNKEQHTEQKISKQENHRMSKRILRSFLYLDENTMDDYLSQLEGGLIEGPYTSKETKSGSKEGGLGGKFLVEASGKLGSSSSSEVSQTIRETPAARFTRLYEILNKESMIQTLNGLDLEIYGTIESGEIIEVRGTAELPQLEKLSKAINEVSNLVDIMTALGLNPLEDPNANLALQGMTALLGSGSQKETVLIIAPLGSPEFKFVTKLDSSRILRKKEELETEVTILGKVHKCLAKGEKIDIFHLMPGLDQLEKLNQAQKLNRTQRRTKSKTKSTPIDSPLDEAIEYPAIQIHPIAIYQ